MVLFLIFKLYVVFFFCLREKVDQINRETKSTKSYIVSILLQVTRLRAHNTWAGFESKTASQA